MRDFVINYQVYLAAISLLGGVIGSSRYWVDKSDGGSKIWMTGSRIAPISIGLTLALLYMSVEQFLAIAKTAGPDIYAIFSFVLAVAWIPGLCHLALGAMNFIAHLSGRQSLKRE